MKRKILFTLAACLTVILMITGCGSNGASDDDMSAVNTDNNVEINKDFVQSIIDRGYLVVGCKTDVPDLSFYDEETDTWSGLEVELAYKTAARLFDVDIDKAKSEGLVHFEGVTVADREQKLNDGEIDLMLATFTITDERAERYAFSDSYYTDYIGVMVRDSGSADDMNTLGGSDIKSIADLDGKYIGVPKNATTRDTFLKYIESMNTVKTSPIFNEYESYEVIFNALKKGDIDAMSVDVSILNGYVDDSTKILDIRFGGQKYGGAVNPENSELLTYLNKAILE